MSALSLSIDAYRPLNRWDYSAICPGPVGSVGDCLITERLKSSLPGDFRWSSEHKGGLASAAGSNVRNGYQKSYVSGGGPSRLIDSNWGGRRGFKVRHGWYMQDMVPPAKSSGVELGALPQYGWRNKIATNIRARSTGDLFPIPRGGVLQMPTGPSRGSEPRVTDVVGGDQTVFQPSSAPSYNQFGGFQSSEAANKLRQQNGRANVLGKTR